MREIELSADKLVEELLDLSENEPVSLLDSCGVSNLGSHLLIAGIKPLESFEITNDDAEKTLAFLDEKFSNTDLAFIFSISYDFGLKLEKINSRQKEFTNFSEPDVFLSAFDCLIIYDYETGKTHLTGNEKRFDEIEIALVNNIKKTEIDENFENKNTSIASNFARESYILTIEKIQELIRRGDTYQTNLTQQFHAKLPENLTAQKIFWRLRKSHPAPFAAFLKRNDDYVVSISPERFFKTENGKRKTENGNSINFHTISASPIKGTRPRGKTAEEDLTLRNELLTSEKDWAENTMIVDLLRNDVGKTCEFGSVKVEKLCDLETHPTLFHLVSTISGALRENINFTDILKAVFPCGSITGAPKINTMQIIDELETANRGLSMGAIGYSIQNSKFKIQNSIDLNVAIRTMVVRNREAIFNVGGGIVIDSVPVNEYEETLVKAKALLNALGANEKQILK
ncbi:MAG TPA: anthranilate synthase component I family protein [Pyrinomonadaceae bacterium]|nr:anthranilate synthase component I family protein [Pyrinomonadaceae bacterium]